MDALPLLAALGCVAAFVLGVIVGYGLGQDRERERRQKSAGRLDHGRAGYAPRTPVRRYSERPAGPRPKAPSTFPPNARRKA